MTDQAPGFRLAQENQEHAALLLSGDWVQGQQAPEFEELRSIGREIKEHTLAHLDFYLERFEEKYARNPDARAVARRSRREIELYREHSQHYGYLFFIMERMNDL